MVHRHFQDLKCILDHDYGPYESPRASPGGDISGSRLWKSITEQGGGSSTTSKSDGKEVYL